MICLYLCILNIVSGSGCECAEEPPDSDRVWQAAKSSKEGAADENS